MTLDENFPLLDQVGEGDLLYDQRQNEHFVVVSVAKNGITLFRKDREYYIPHTIFAEWYGRSEVAQNDAISAASPGWVDWEPYLSCGTLYCCWIGNQSTQGCKSIQERYCFLRPTNRGLIVVLGCGVNPFTESLNRRNCACIQGAYLAWSHADSSGRLQPG